MERAIWFIFTILVGAAGLIHSQITTEVLTASQSAIRLPSQSRVIDSAISRSGDVYLLTPDGFMVVETATGEVVPHRFDPGSTVRDPEFVRSDNLALTMDASDRAVILWNGRRPDGTVENYVATVGLNDSVALAAPVLVTVHDFVLGQAGQILIHGLPRGVADTDLVYQYSPSGELLRSFHQVQAESFRKLGHSFVVAAQDSVYVLNGLVSPTVHEYRNGFPTATYGLEHESQNRAILSMFSVGGRIYLHSVVGQQLRATDTSGERVFTTIVEDEQQIHVLREGALHLQAAGVKGVGPLIGATPDGHFVALNKRNQPHPIVYLLKVQRTVEGSL